MIIITQYKKLYNQKTNIWTIIAMEESVCPYCGTPVKSRDSRLRSGIKTHGAKCWYRIRRLRCPGCGKIHTELPDFLHPYKHYETAAIQNEIDEITPSCCAADNSTIRIWRGQWKRAQPAMSGALASLRARFLNLILPLTCKEDIVAQIRSSEKARWLPFVIRQLTGGGFSIYTKFAFCP
jgi:hypothetical protein